MTDIKISVGAWKITTYRNQGKCGAQNKMLEDIGCMNDGAPEDVFPILSHTPRYGRWWGAANLKQLSQIIKKDQGIYEILTKNGKRKVYFDVDKTDKTLEEIEEIILKHFPGAVLQISGYLGSYHIILSNYYAENNDAMWQIKLFCSHYKEYGFDAKVYTKTRNMKCINQSKSKTISKGVPRPPRQLYIKGSEVLSKHLIMHDFDDD